MRLEFCSRKNQINFGDNLNEWLWPKLIECDFKSESPSTFLGIGTILTPKRIKKVDQSDRVIVFSSGVWSENSISLSEHWHVYGVRGPRTARALGLPEEFILGDGAYLIRNFFEQSNGSGKEIGFVPHHASELYINWERICLEAGLKYISPKQTTEAFIEDLYQCSAVITEAMHGAIAADALRIPWKAVKFAPNFSEFKWFDWAEALNIDLNIHQLPFYIEKPVPFTRVLEDFFKFYLNIILPNRNSDRINTFSAIRKKKKNSEKEIVSVLSGLSDGNYQLSKDKDFQLVLDRLNCAVKKLNEDVKQGACV